MGTNFGSKTVDNGLVVWLDAKSKQSTMRNYRSSNILNDPFNWSAGTGGASGYGANGAGGEQSRAIRTDPWGRQSMTWRSTPDSTSGADGGWNTSNYSIDTGSTYRWSVWCKRYTAGTGGNFYLGMNPAPVRNDNNSVQGNPYWYCPAISNMVQDRWYLIVGHCFYESYRGGRHPNSGWWYKDTSTGQLVKDDRGFCNTGSQDVRWNPGTTTGMHRTYHFYTTNTASGLEWCYPRVDKLDGSEPSINDLFEIGEGGWKSLTNNTVANFRSGSTMPTFVEDPGYWSFNGVDQYADFLNESGFNTGNGIDFTFEIWFKMRTLPTAQYAANGHIWGGEIGNDVVMYLNPASGGASRGIMNYDDSRYNTGHMTNSGFEQDTWHQWVAIGDGSANTIDHYINGQLDRSNGPVLSTQYVRSWGGTRLAYDSRWNTYSSLVIAIVRQYNRKLTANEISKNFAASRGRFGI